MEDSTPAAQREFKDQEDDMQSYLDSLENGDLDDILKSDFSKQAHPFSIEAENHDEAGPFLNAPETLWEEPQTEKILTYMGNARNYYFYGSGSAMDDQDLFACLASETTSTHEIHPRIAKRYQGNPGVQKVLPFKCQSAEGCICGVRSRHGSTPSDLYPDLPTDDHIRLLEILPGSDGDVECLLHVGHLPDDKHTYEALSYTWVLSSWLGRENNHEAQVKCNGKPLIIGANLASALHRLRKSDISRMIWADALCINQRDDKERSHQVMHMDLIYQSAFRVVVWLGEETARPYQPAPPVKMRQSYQALTGICSVINTWRTASGNDKIVPIATHSSHVEGAEIISDHDVLSSNSKTWHDIFSLFRCRWFSRLWTIQEVALARTAIVVWDECEVEWEWVGLAAAIIRTNYDRISTSIRDRSNDFFGVAPTRRVPSGVSNAYFVHRLSKSQRYSEPLRFTFLELLKLTRHFGCKDPRDRIYGLLGLPTSDSVNGDLIADYTRTTEEVYLSAARLIIESSASLSVLSSVQRDSNNPMMKPWKPGTDHFTTELPSWVPQWDFLLTSSILPSQPSSSFNAALDEIIQIQKTEDPDQLVLRGILVDAVSGCSYAGFRDFWRGADKADEVQGGNFWSFGRTHEAFPIEDKLKTLSSTRKRLEKIAVTITAGQNWYGVPVQDASAHLADYAKCLLKDGLIWSLNADKFAAQTQDQDEDHPGGSEGNEHIGFAELEAISKNGNADRFLDTAATVLERRARFVTGKGLFGVGPEAMKKNDIICVLYGAAVPFVLRRKSDGFLLVGECYVHDLMRGEAVTQLHNQGSAKKLKEAWFKLI